VLQQYFSTDRHLAPQFEGKWEEYFTPATFNEKKAKELRGALARLKEIYTLQIVGASESMDSVKMVIEKGLPKGVTLYEYKDKYFSEQLNDVMQNESSIDKFVMDRGMLIQVTDPGLQIPLPKANPLNYRSHFYAPKKYFAGGLIDTFWFNVLLVWTMTLLLYVALYFEWLKNSINFLSKLGGDKD
jgi:hypothetical protein